MRVRGLQTYLASQKLVNSEPIERLKHLKIGVDAVYWLRTLPNLKDPLADAIGGVPPGLFGVLDTNLSTLDDLNISMLFVSQGTQPPSHMLFSSQLHQQMYEGWRCVGTDDYFAAQHHFALATSRINSDFMFVVSRYLQSKGCEIMQAPYLAAAQLLYFAQEGLIDAVFGPPALVLFGIPRVITGMNLQDGTFEWVELSQLLTAWNITKEQLIDSCLLAGAEYCLTFPYLNLSQFHGGAQQFHFGTAVDFIRQAPLIGYMQHFPNEEMRLDHIDGYCVCKSLIKYPIALHLDGTVRAVKRRPVISVEIGQEEKTSQRADSHEESPALQPSSHVHDAIAVPEDFHKIVGYRLPSALCFLMARRFLNRKLPSVLALGEWWDRSYPTVDSVEYRDLFNEVQGYRCRALGLIASRLHPFFHTRVVRFSRRVAASGVSTATPDCRPGMAWNFTLDQLLKEMQRQQVTRCSFKFCLSWHAYETSLGRKLVDVRRVDSATAAESFNFSGPLADVTDIRVFEAVVYFMLLENLGYFTATGGVTVFGSAVASASAEFDEDVLCALELMKCGDLMGEPVEAPPDRPFPPEVTILRKPENLEFQRHILLLTRVVSLIPMQLNNSDLWLAPVDFDLAAFHSIVKVMKKTFRHLSEACVANLLLKDLRLLHTVPASELSLDTPRFPVFMIPRNCMGIVFKHFLEFRYDPSKRSGWAAGGGTGSTRDAQTSSTSTTATNALFRRLRRLDLELNMYYRCCKDPIGDIFKGLRFWLETVRIIELLAQNIDVSILKVDMDEAHHFLLRRIAETGLYLHHGFKAECFTPLRASLAPYIAAANAAIMSATTGHTAAPQAAAPAVAEPTTTAGTTSSSAPVPEQASSEQTGTPSTDMGATSGSSGTVAVAAGLT